MQTTKFRERVEFINLIKTQNDSGGIETAESTLAERWAYVRTKPGKRADEGAKVVNKTVIEMWCRVDPSLKAGIGPETRVIWKDKYYTIEGYDIEDNRDLIYKFVLNGV